MLGLGAGVLMNAAMAVLFIRSRPTVQGGFIELRSVWAIGGSIDFFTGFSSRIRFAKNCVVAPMRADKTGDDRGLSC